MGRRMQPIRDLEEIFRASEQLRQMDSPQGRRMYLLWVVGINLGMRISDLVDLKVGDLRDKNSYTYLPHKQEHKRGAQSITIPIPTEVKKAVREKCAGMPDEAWLFPSARTTPVRKRKAPEQKSVKTRERPVNVGAISRQTALRDLKRIQRECGIREDIGCHTMRKTFGYHYFRNGGSLQLLQQWFYHETPATTLVYIGIQFDDFQKMVGRNPFAGMAG